MIESWMVIVGVTLLVALGSFLFAPRYRVGKAPEPTHWLVFEPVIPVIWTVVLFRSCKRCPVWEKDPGVSELGFDGVVPIGILQ